MFRHDVSTRNYCCLYKNLSWAKIADKTYLTVLLDSNYNLITFQVQLLQLSYRMWILIDWEVLLFTHQLHMSRYRFQLNIFESLQLYMLFHLRLVDHFSWKDDRSFHWRSGTISGWFFFPILLSFSHILIFQSE